MNNKIPAYYPEVPSEVSEYLREINDIIVPACIEGEELRTVTPKIGSSALFPSYAMIGSVLFTIYLDKKDCWEDAYYDAWYNSEDKSNENLLTDLAIESIKSLEYWER